MAPVEFTQEFIEFVSTLYLEQNLSTIQAGALFDIYIAINNTTEYESKPSSQNKEDALAPPLIFKTEVPKKLQGHYVLFL